MGVRKDLCMQEASSVPVPCLSLKQMCLRGNHDSILWENHSLDNNVHHHSFSLPAVPQTGRSRKTVFIFAV